MNVQAGRNLKALTAEFNSLLKTLYAMTKWDLFQTAKLVQHYKINQWNPQCQQTEEEISHNYVHQCRKKQFAKIQH